MGYHERYERVNHDADAKPKDIPWLVEGLILRGGITALLGPEKTGKSRLLGWLLASMLAQPNGGPVLRREWGVQASHTGIRKVLYLNAEEQATDVMARVNAYARFNGYEPSPEWPIHYVTAAGMQLQRQIERNEFEQEFLKDQQYDWVIADPLRRIHAGNENDNSSMAGLHNDIRRWTQQYSQTWTLVHHSPKFREDDDLERIATWSRGNTDLVTLLDGAIMMRSLGGGKEMQRRVVKTSGRFPPQDDLLLHDYGDPKGFVVQP
jgi:RecA-family ATPase